MRSTVIPAQITTVEDKIAGNLNLTQIMLFLGAIFATTFLYVVLLPTYHLTPLKVIVGLVIVIGFVTLAIRTKGKIILDWLLILSRFTLRPKYYVYDKNDSYLRTLYLPEIPLKAKLFAKRVSSQKTTSIETADLGIKDLVKLDALVKDKNLSFSFKTSKKGGLNVAFEQI